MSKVVIFTPKKFGDERGWFTEIYNARREANAGIQDVFVQDNQSFSKLKGTVRGIHFQRPPHAQAKLVRCTRGSLRDYVVDLREGSPTYGKYICVELSAENGRQLYVPIGFGHAFITLEDSTEISYKVTDFYSAESDGGIRWDCPHLSIDWSLDGVTLTLSEKDRNLPTLNEFESPFAYDGFPLQT